VPEQENWLYDADSTAPGYRQRGEAEGLAQARSARPEEPDVIEQRPPLNARPARRDLSSPERFFETRQASEAVAQAGCATVSTATPFSVAHRVLFFIASLLALATFWWPHLPMIDLPQHAAQVALLRDLLLGKSHFSSLVSINLFTPYLIGYLFALPLSFVLSASVAVQLVLAASFIAFVGSCVALRRELSDDYRFDWLFLPGFFAFPYIYGVYNFLVAAPFVVYCIVMQLRFAQEPTPRSGARIVMFGVFLLFSHGLGLALSLVSGFVTTLTCSPFSLKQLRIRLWPYATLGLLAVVVFKLMRFNASGVSGAASPFAEFEWFSESIPLRMTRIFVYLGTIWTGDSLVIGLIVGAVIAAVMINPRVRWSVGGALFLMIAAILLFAPDTFAGVLFVRHRFTMFFLPFLALALAVPRGMTARPWPKSVSVIGYFGLAAAVFTFFVIQLDRARAFATEGDEFDRILGAALPNQRALAVIYEKNSLVGLKPSVYLHWPLWYQAEKSGFVEYNFAHFEPQIVRFRSDAECSYCYATHFRPQVIDWSTVSIANYHYFFVRGAQEHVAAIQARSSCQFAIAANSGRWWLLEAKPPCG
jgi:hypothetical protein